MLLGMLAGGAPAVAQTQTDAISREFTVWVDNLVNPPITDAMSREFTVYVGTQPLRPQTDAVTREFTVFVDPFGGPGGLTDAISREFTVDVGTQPLREQTDAISREFTVFVDEGPPAPQTDAISREFTAYIGTQPLREQTDAITREFTAFVGEFLACPSWVYLVDGPSTNTVLAYEALAYDTDRGVAVYVGGGFFLGDGTHEWDGVSWTTRTPFAPSLRATIAYDAARGRIVTFGGSRSGVGVIDETWVWDGNHWQQLLPVTRPPACTRSTAAMVFDDRAGVIVLYIGGTGTSGPSSTWLWDGSNWAQCPAASPPRRRLFPLAFDSLRGVTVLFGGENASGVLGDTWEFDGDQWVQRASDGPPARLGAAMAFADLPRQMVLHGGAFDYGDADSIVADTWLWNGVTWTQQPDSSAPGLEFHAIVPTRVSGFLSAFGGFRRGPSGTEIESRSTYRIAAGMTLPAFLVQPISQGVAIGGVAAFSASAYGGPTAQSYRWRKDGADLSDGPSAGGGTIAGATADTLNVMSVGDADAGAYDVIVTNACGSVTSDIAQLTIQPACPPTAQLWSQRAVAGPPPRDGACAAFDSNRNVTVLFGGYSFDGVSTSYNDTWEWNGTVWTQRNAPGMAARFSAAMAYDSARQRTVMFGGDGPTIGVNNETWEWDGNAWQLRATSGPSARRFHALAYDAARGVAVLFGGYADGAPLNDTWEWNGTTWTQRSVSGPPARAWHRMAYDSQRHVTVLFGGRLPGVADFNDTWEWDGVSWQQRAVAGPPPRHTHVMAYDSLRRATVVFGGLFVPASGDPYAIDDTWFWDGSQWTQLAGGAPPPRNQSVMVFDAARAAMVVFGGRTGPTYDGETWELHTSAITISQQPANLTVCAEQQAVFGVVVSSPGAISYRWRRNGAALTDGGNVSGATTATLMLGNTQAADAAFYDVLITGACGSVTSAAGQLTVSAPCPGDGDGDRDVDQDDLDIVLFNFGQAVPPGTNGDLDGDGDVDQDDLDLVLFNFGTVYP